MSPEIAAGVDSPPAASTASNPRYMPGLDVMRGLAITLVLVYHGAAQRELVFLAHPTPAFMWLRGLLHLGSYGVHLFFILSGFLITGILLDSRTQPDYFRNFYLRRVLRIVPAYLVMLTVLMLTRSISLRYLAICLLYFCNMSGIFGAAPEYGPLWSLSVEEQFYLFWPLVVRKLRTRSLAVLSIALIIFTPMLRFAILYAPPALSDINFKTWDVMDFFAAGSCLSLAVRSPQLRPRLSGTLAPLLLAGAALLVLLLWLPILSAPLPRNLFYAIGLEPWLFGFSSLVLLAYLYPGIASLAVARPLIFLANISYGLYLYHVFVFRTVDTHWPTYLTANMSRPAQALLEFAVEAALSIAVAYISRNTLEEFFLCLKPKHRSSPARAEAAQKIT